MKFRIVHEIKGRMRIHLSQKQMTMKEADMLQYYLESQSFISSAKVYERNQDVAVCFKGDRQQVITLLQHFQYETVLLPETMENSGRELNREYWDKLVGKVFNRAMSKCFLPMPVRTVITVAKSTKYIWQGIRTLAKGKMEVAVLDATAVAVSVLRKDINTAGSIMFLLGIGEILEDWTHKKSVGDLARSMSLNISKVWKVAENGQEVLVSTDNIKVDDEIIVHMGNVIAFDGIVSAGEGSVNQASLTGEGLPVRKAEGSFVYAGTVLEEGELTIRVKEVYGATRFEKIVTMIEESEKLKSSVEGKAAHVADELVPYTLLGTAVTYLLTRNVTKALAVLMVDFSCALKLAIPISVLSAIREASNYHITVKGGKFLEKVAQADTIVFDKTGTLTKAQPLVVDVISFDGEEPDELLRTAACLEEHFPHSMAKAVVNAAVAKGLLHEEKHSKVEYIVAHGISSTVEGKKVVIGSYHFIFEDEKCQIPEGMQEKFDGLREDCSHLYMAVEGMLAAVICIEDPLREEAVEVIQKLRSLGIKKFVMMTGDSERTARSIARKVGVDEYYSEVLPEDKASFVEKEKASNQTVIMIGDGINDSPALSASDVGIAVSEGAEIAREIADIIIGIDDLNEIVTLKELSDGLMKRIQKNYRKIVGINSGLIVLGVLGVIQPTTSALFHNTSTLMISLNSMKNIKIEKQLQ